MRFMAEGGGAVLKPLTDALDVAERIGRGVLAIEGIPGDERQRYRAAVEATFDILHQSVVLLLNRVGDILNMDLDPNQPTHRTKLAMELKGLGNIAGWHDIERQVRLCSRLRMTRREMEGMRDRLSGKVALADWQGFKGLVDALLLGESALANTLAGAMFQLAQRATAARRSPAEAEAALQALDRMLIQLGQVRLLIVKKQVELLETI